MSSVPPSKRMKLTAARMDCSHLIHVLGDATMGEDARRAGK